MALLAGQQQHAPSLYVWCKSLLSCLGQYKVTPTMEGALNLFTNLPHMPPFADRLGGGAVRAGVSLGTFALLLLRHLAASCMLVAEDGGRGDFYASFDPGSERAFGPNYC